MAEECDPVAGPGGRFGMKQTKSVGVEFQFEKGYLHTPIHIGGIQLYQFGEKSTVNGYEVGEHVQICHELSYIVSGEGSTTINGQEYAIAAGDLIFNRMGERHAIGASAQSKMRYFYFGFLLPSHTTPALEQLRTFYDSAVLPRVVRDTQELITVFSKLLDEFYLWEEFSDALVGNLLEQLLLYSYRQFIRPSRSSDIALRAEAEVGGTVYAVVRYVEQHVLSMGKLAAMAEELGYSYAYLSHEFKKKTGLTIQEYTRRKKMEKGLQMLRSGRWSVTQTAELLGYDSAQAFGKAFKREMGLSPTQSRMPGMEGILPLEQLPQTERFFWEGELGTEEKEAEHHEKTEG